MNLKQIAFDAAFWVCIYYGLYLGNEWAENLLVLWLFLAIGISLIASIFLSDEFCKKALEDKDIEVPKNHGQATKIYFKISFASEVVALAFFGWIFAACAYFLLGVIGILGRNNLVKISKYLEGE